MIIRNETISDIEAISKVTIAAFKNFAISNHTEQFIINALREANALTISLVAEIDGKIVGHIPFFWYSRHRETGPRAAPPFSPGEICAGEKEL